MTRAAELAGISRRRAYRLMQWRTSTVTDEARDDDQPASIDGRKRRADG
jgi:hypothetical protein